MAATPVGRMLGTVARYESEQKSGAAEIGPRGTRGNSVALSGTGPPPGSNGSLMVRHRIL
jgi:hypothetical protein